MPIDENVRDQIDTRLLSDSSDEISILGDWFDNESILDRTQKATLLQAIKDCTLPQFLRFSNGLAQQNPGFATHLTEALTLHNFVHNNVIINPQTSNPVQACSFFLSIDQLAPDTNINEVQEELQQRLGQYINRQYEDIQQETIDNSIRHLTRQGLEAFQTNTGNTLSNIHTCYLHPDNRQLIDPKQQFLHALTSNCNESQQMIQQAINDGGPELLERSFNGKKPLQLADENEQVDVVNLLLKNGADLNVLRGNSQRIISDVPFAHALILAGYHEGLSSLPPQSLEASDRANRTPLHQAVFMDNERAVEIILDQNPFLTNEIESVNGMTPLHMAAGSNNPNLVAQLAHNSCFLLINAENQQRQTALDIAIQEANAEVVGELLKNSQIDLDQVNTKYGVSLSHQDLEDEEFRQQVTTTLVTTPARPNTPSISSNHYTLSANFAENGDQLLEQLEHLELDGEPHNPSNQ